MARESIAEVHPFPPFFDCRSRILILGSFPSVKSRETGFFYGHPRNRFWQVLSGLLNEPCPETIPEKRRLLSEHHIALWDVIHSCEISGSSDASIRNVVPNDLREILEHAKIRQIFTNGGTSYLYYEKYMEPAAGRKAVRLPSTSPANASWSLPRLKEAWAEILPYL